MIYCDAKVDIFFVPTNFLVSIFAIYTLSK